MYVHCSIRPFCFAAARLRPASAMPRGKSASSRCGGRGRGGGVERVEQSGPAPTMGGVVRLSTAMNALAKLEKKLKMFK